MHEGTPPMNPQLESNSQENHQESSVNVEAVQTEFQLFSDTRNDALRDMFKQNSVTENDVVTLRMLNPDASLPERVFKNIKKFARERLDATLHGDNRSTMEAARHASNLLLIGEQPNLSSDDYGFINTGHENILGMEYRSNSKITPAGAAFSADLAILGKRPVLNANQMALLQKRTNEAQQDARIGSKPWYDFVTFAASQRILGGTIELSKEDWTGILQETERLRTKAGKLGTGNTLDTQDYVSFTRNVVILAHRTVATVPAGGLAINGRELAPKNDPIR